MATYKELLSALSTDRQRRFVEEYLVDGNGKRAATAAGFSAKTAHAKANTLLKKTEIQAALEAGREKISKRTEVTQDMVIEGLLKEATFYGDNASHGARVSAWEKLGKQIGMFVDRKVIGMKRIDDMTEEELAFLLGQDSASD